MGDLSAQCPDVEAAAPDLALGSLAGSERAATLSHLAQCPTCRRLVDELSAAADPLLLLAPEMEPSIGFESRVLAATTGAAAAAAAAGGAGADRSRPVAAAAAPPRHRRRARARRPFSIPKVGVAAAVVLLAAVGGLAVGRTLDSPPPDNALRIATAVSANGKATCRALAYGDKQSWVFVSFEAPREWTADYLVEITTEGGGSPATVGHLRLQDGGGSLGTVVDVPASQLRAVRVLDASGALRYEAPFQKT